MWKVELHKKVQKKFKVLPLSIKEALFFLAKEIEDYGPTRRNWPNYSPLGENRHHCHLKKGKPTYVAVWEVINKTKKLVEIIYAGTHEKAPY